MNTAPVKKICDKHGNYDSEPITFLTGRIIRWTECPVCERRQKELEELAKAEKRMAEEERRRETAFLKAVNVSGIAPRFLEADLSEWIANSPAEKKAGLFASDFARDFAKIIIDGRCAVFVGNVGAGKTYLACAIGLDVMRQGYSVRYTTVLRAMRRIKATFDNEMRDETVQEAIEAFTEPDLLILDEVGVQFGSDYERQTMTDIIDLRYERFRPTIFISNVPANELKKYIGIRAADRVNDKRFGVIAFDWESRRQ